MRKTPVVLGILCMALGGLTSLSGLFGLAAQPLTRVWTDLLSNLLSRAPHRPGQPDPVETMRRTADAMEVVRPYQLALSATLLVLSLAVIVIGYGMYRRRRWSRPAAIAWGTLALFHVALMTWLQAAIIQPRVHEAMRASMSGGKQLQFFEAMTRAQSMLAVVSAIGFYAPFPIILIVLMGRRSAKADFTS